MSTPASTQEKQGTVETATLANLFGLTTARLQQLAGQGVIIRAGRGRWELWPSVRGYIGFLREKVRGRGFSDDGQAGSVGDARRRKLVAEAETAELELAELRGDLIRLADAEDIIVRALGPLANQIDDMPRVMAGDLPGDPIDNERRLRRWVESQVKPAVRKIMDDIASGKIAEEEAEPEESVSNSA